MRFLSIQINYWRLQVASPTLHASACSNIVLPWVLGGIGSSLFGGQWAPASCVSLVQSHLPSSPDLCYIKGALNYYRCLHAPSVAQRHRWLSKQANMDCQGSYISRVKLRLFNCANMAMDKICAGFNIMHAVIF